MAKKALISSEELASVIQAEIEKSTELDGDCRACELNSVYWHEPDENGSNWDVHSFRGPSVCAGVINAIANRYKSEYNLKD